MTMEINSPEAAEWSRLMKHNSELEHQVSVLRACILEARAVAEMDDLPQWVEHYDKALNQDSGL